MRPRTASPDTDREGVTAQRLRPFGTTIFAEMTQLATQYGAINLAQGFPDFDGPKALLDAGAAAVLSGQNQYARSQGHASLVSALAADYERRLGRKVDPLTQIGTFSGCTEALMAAMLGLLDPGDEVILFEPFYDSYPACVACAGAVPRFATLRFPDFAFDAAAFEALITPRTRLVVLNSPHNPTGKVFTRDELVALGDICKRHDLILVSDEVYEHITFDGVEFVSPASLDSLADRTLVLSSAGKTFSVTGWKVGWSYGPATLVAAAQSAHQFITFSTSTPFQVALAQALAPDGPLGSPYLDTLRADYTARRDYLMDALKSLGFIVTAPQGTYFILADFTPLFDGDDRAFVRHLVAEVGIAAIPPSVFYGASDDGRRLVRFAFCKRPETLTAAVERLSRPGAFRRP